MAARTLPTAKRLPLGRAQLRTIHHKPLELLADDDGSVTLGWVDVGVFYARFIGMFSLELSQQHNARVEAALERRSPLHYFADARALGGYDLDARSAFFLTVLAHRQQFKSVVLLTWTTLGITPIARSYVSTIGEPVEVLADEHVFEDRLLKVAPLARGKIDPNGWVLPPPPLPRAPR
jgi:hypothetical protein